MRGEIVGAEHREHAVRLVPQRHPRSHLRVQPALRGAIGIGLGRDVDLGDHGIDLAARFPRSEEHTSELQSLMRISYAVFCLKKKKKSNTKLTSTRTSSKA